MCALLVLLAMLTHSPAPKPHATHAIGTAVIAYNWRGGHATRPSWRARP